jgi:hypothetical protein
MAEVLIDTNILVYAHQPAEKDSTWRRFALSNTCWKAGQVA